MTTTFYRGFSVTRSDDSRSSVYVVRIGRRFIGSYSTLDHAHRGIDDFLDVLRSP